VMTAKRERRHLDVRFAKAASRNTTVHTHDLRFDARVLPEFAWLLPIVRQMKSEFLEILHFAFVLLGLLKR
jgi:hypothetical protein